MRIGEVNGRVTLARQHPALRHARFALARILPLEALTDGSPLRGEEMVVFDELGAGPGARIGISEGIEAANPFPHKTPVDAYCACLLDRIDVERPR